MILSSSFSSVVPCSHSKGTGPWIALLGFTLAVLSSSADGGTTIRVSVGPHGEQGNSLTFSFAGLNSVSADGMVVAFESRADNFAPGDTNEAVDVFLRDRVQNTTILLSKSLNGLTGDDFSGDPWITADARYVVFTSGATNLIPGDTNGRTDVFLWDRLTEQLQRMSLDSQGDEVFGDSYAPFISDNGRIVVFTSAAYTLVPNDTNFVPDVFAKDRQTGRTGRVSVGPHGEQANGGSDTASVSSDGRYVAFVSTADNLVSGDTNLVADVFVKDLVSGAIRRVSVDSSGVEGDGPSGLSGAQISGNGRYVAFSSDATHLVPVDHNNRTDIFIYDLLTGETTRASVSSLGEEPINGCLDPSISADGGIVAWDSGATNLVPSDTNHQSDVFAHDRLTGETTRVSVTTGGGQGNLESRFPSVSSTGRFIALKSISALVPEDTNGLKDVYLHDRFGAVLNDVVPGSGSEAGGDLVNVDGCGFTDVASTTVLFGGVAANVVSVRAERIQVRTPPGTGRVDLDVMNSITSGHLVGAFSYVDPVLAALYGNVNVALGDRENLLLANSSIGDPVNREVRLAVNQPVEFRILAPSSRQLAHYALYAWGGRPTAATLSAQPFGLGSMVMPTPMTGGSPQPRFILNNAGHNDMLGTPSFPSAQAPVILGSRTFPAPHTMTIQGIIQDDGSSSAHAMSITNALILRVQ